MNTLDQSIVQLQSSPYWNERREAALALGRCREPQALDVLIDALNDPDDDVLQAVVVALGKIGDERAVEHISLPRYLNHPDPRIRWATLQSIEKIGKSFVVTEVSELVNDKEWIVRNEAQKTLRKQVESVVTDCSLESAQRMIGLLNTGDEELRRTLIEAFIRMGPRIKSLLRDFVKLGGKRIQTALAYILGKLKDKKAIPVLIDLLDDPDKSIRKSAVEALGQIADPISVPSIIEKFGDSSLEVQHSAIAAVAEIGKPAVEILHETLRYSSRKSIQKNILFTLARIRDLSSIPHFIEYLGSTYFIVRRAAVTGLVQYGKDAVEEVQKVIRNIELPMIDDLLKQAEKGATTGIRIRAINALGALADHRAVHLLKRLSACQEPAVQKASLASLAKIGCSCWQRCCTLTILRELRIVPDLDLIVEQLDDDSENVRYRTVQVLARSNNPQAVPALLQTVAIDGNANIRLRALRAADELIPADPLVVDAARKALDDPSPHVQAEAVRIIARSPDVKNLVSLMECLKNPSWEVRRNTALALGNMGNIALPSLLERLSVADETELESVIRAIGNIGTPSTLPEIEKAIANVPADSPVRYAAQKAIEDIREKETNTQ